MTNKFEPGALAVVMVSEWPRNRYRVVELVEPYPGANCVDSWIVLDPNGTDFDGHQAYAGTCLGTGEVLTSKTLGIARWKLRPLDAEYDELVELNGTHYCLKGIAA